MTNPSHDPRTYSEYLGRKYMPELDGLRAISVLLVVSVHLHATALWEWLGGWQGVSIFFVLSGYLITSLALREESKRGQLSLGAFYIRRSFRIFPLYYLTLGVYCLLIFGLRMNYDEKGFLLAKAMPWYLLYMQEVPVLCGLPNQHGVVQIGNIPFYQSWSLGIEEKFYLVWPLLAFVLWRGSRALRFAGTTALVAAFAAVPLVCGWLAPLVPRMHLVDIGLCLEPYYRILVGCLLALALNDRAWFERLRGLGTATATAIALAIVVVLHFVRPMVPPQGEWLQRLADVHGLAYILAVAAFLIGVLLGDGPIHRFLRRPRLVLVGRISYGIYLIHILCTNVAEKILACVGEGLVFNLLAYALTAALSIAVAYALYRLIEHPLIEFGRRWSNRVLDRGPVRLATVGAEEL